MFGYVSSTRQAKEKEYVLNTNGRIVGNSGNIRAKGKAGRGCCFDGVWYICQVLASLYYYSQSAHSMEHGHDHLALNRTKLCWSGKLCAPAGARCPQNWPGAAPPLVPVPDVHLVAFPLFLFRAWRHATLDQDPSPPMPWPRMNLQAFNDLSAVFCVS